MVSRSCFVSAATAEPVSARFRMRPTISTASCPRTVSRTFASSSSRTTVARRPRPSGTISGTLWDGADFVGERDPRFLHFGVQKRDVARIAS